VCIGEQCMDRDVKKMKITCQYTEMSLSVS